MEASDYTSIKERIAPQFETFWSPTVPKSGNCHDYLSSTIEKGIIFFKDYWMRSADNPGRLTGGHIDLWNGSRLTDLSSWVRIIFSLTIPRVWSDFERSKHIAFWKVDE